MRGGPEKWSCALFVLHWQLFKFETPRPVSLLPDLCLQWSWVITKSCSTMCTDKLPLRLFLLADLARFTPLEPKCRSVLLGLFWVFLLFFFFFDLPATKGVKRMVFNAPTLIFGFLFSPISWIYIAFLSDFVYWSCVWPCSVLTGLCNTSQYIELQLPSSHYIVSYIFIQLFHGVFSHSTCFALGVNMEE